jgi:hypothetical protein
MRKLKLKKRKEKDVDAKKVTSSKPSSSSNSSIKRPKLKRRPKDKQTTTAEEKPAVKASESAPAKWTPDQKDWYPHVPPEQIPPGQKRRMTLREYKDSKKALFSAKKEEVPAHLRAHDPRFNSVGLIAWDRPLTDPATQRKAEHYLFAYSDFLARIYDLFWDIADLSPELSAEIDADLREHLRQTLVFMNKLLGRWKKRWPTLRIPPQYELAWPEVNPEPPKGFAAWLKRNTACPERKQQTDEQPRKAKRKLKRKLKKKK